MRVSLLIGALASARALEECALSAANECFACPEGARCSTYDPESPETLEVRTGFWRVSADVLAPLLACPRGEAACPGDRGAAAGDALCAEGYAGAMCDACDDGFAPRSDGTCAECDADYRTKVLQAAGVAAGVALVATLLWYRRGEDFLLWLDERWDGEEKFKRLGHRLKIFAGLAQAGSARRAATRDARARDGSLALAATRSLPARARANANQPVSVSRRCSRSCRARCPTSSRACRTSAGSRGSSSSSTST